MSAGPAVRPTLRGLVRAGPSAFLFTVLAGLLALVPGLAVPLLIRTFLDQYLVAGATDWGVPAVVGLLVAALTAGALSWLQYLVLGRFAVRLSATRSTAFVWHALRIPVPDVEALGTGDIMARGAVTQRLAFQGGMIVPLSFVSSMTVIVYSAVLLVLDLRLGTAALVVVVASALLSYGLLRRRAAWQREADRARVAQSSLTSEIVSSVETVKASAAEQWLFARWCRSRDTVGRAASRLGISGQRLEMVGPLAPTVGLGVVLAVGIWMVLAGQLTLGTLVASQGLLLQVLVRTGQLVWLGVLLSAVQSADEQAAVVQDVALDPEVRRVPEVSLSVSGDRSAAVSLRSVTFGYDRAAAPLLRDLHLDVPTGSRVAVVGSSGSGKSTLVKLVVGELQPWSGQVLIDGVPRLDLPRGPRTHAVAYVPQVPVLVPGTIRDNITLFDDGVPAAEVVAAVRDACIEDAIAARPLGLDEPVAGSGHGFSGGELQRLAIARALCHRPSILVLDEATSALDPVVEVEVERNLGDRACTCLVVAHRLSTVRDADHIVLLDGGHILEQGPYAELRKHGRFAEMLHG
ncbi:MAG: ATP-binding cassette domain-containing protein [Actinobacteria bacterium]|nr:ATP-binding cassette domain-containing protein [Actinomycetota bacterium]